MRIIKYTKLTLRIWWLRLHFYCCIDLDSMKEYDAKWSELIYLEGKRREL